MAGGHGHDGGSAHGAAHGHGGGHAATDSHGAASHGTGGADGPAEIPAAPAERCISPARADFEQPWPGKGLLWPLVWTAVAGVLALLAVAWRGEILQGEHGEHAGHAAGQTPAHGDAEPGMHGEAPAEPAAMAGHGG